MPPPVHAVLNSHSFPQALNQNVNPPSSIVNRTNSKGFTVALTAPPVADVHPDNLIFRAHNTVAHLQNQEPINSHLLTQPRLV
jgi:hypothetical protein